MVNIWLAVQKEGKSYWTDQAETKKFAGYVADGRDFLIFDTETTGLHKKTDRIIQFAAVVYSKNPQTNKYENSESINELINPGFPIPEEASSVNHITDDAVRYSGNEEKVFNDRIVPFLNKHEDAVIMGYNVGFDNGFMSETFKRLYNKPFEPRDVIDTFKCVKENIFFDEHQGNRHLGDIVSLLLPDNIYAYHDASGDIQATWDISVEILKRAVQFNNIHNGSVIPDIVWIGPSVFNSKKGVKGKRSYLNVRIRTAPKEYYNVYFDQYYQMWVNKNHGDCAFDKVNMNILVKKLNTIAARLGKDCYTKIDRELSEQEIDGLLN